MLNTLGSVNHVCLVKLNVNAKSQYTNAHCVCEEGGREGLEEMDVSFFFFFLFLHYTRVTKADEMKMFKKKKTTKKIVITQLHFV